MKILAKMVGGSRAYGLDTPSSDYDERFVFCNTNLSDILGLTKYEHQVQQTAEVDKQGFELRRFVQLLDKTNTTVMEILYNSRWLELDHEFDCLVLKHKERFLNTQAFFKSLKGYVFGERRLMNGERTGKIGSKRKTDLDQFGYSYRNLVQLIRLCYCGTQFFDYGYFPVNIRADNVTLWAMLMDIKLHPQNYSKEQANKLVDEWEQRLNSSFDNRNTSRDYEFDSHYASHVVLKLYYPRLLELYTRQLTDSNE